MMTPGSNLFHNSASPYKITIHGAGGDPDLVINIDKLPEAILTSLASKQPGATRIGSAVAQIHQRIVGELVRRRVSKFGFDGRRITLEEVQTEVS
jgi:hypothetical protein